jgi:hypothetical protein
MRIFKSLAVASIFLGLASCSKEAPVASTKDAVVIGKNGDVYAVYLQGEKVSLRRCPDLTLAETPRDLEEKCPKTTNNQAEFDKSGFKEVLLRTLFQPALRSQIDASAFKAIVEYGETKFLDLKDRRDGLQKRIRAIEDFASKFPGSAGDYEKELTGLRAELAGTEQIAGLSEQLDAYLDQLVAQIIDPLSVKFYRLGVPAEEFEAKLLLTVLSTRNVATSGSGSLHGYLTSWVVDGPISAELPDGSLVYVAGGEVRSFDPRTGVRLRLTDSTQAFYARVWSPVALPSGKIVFAAEDTSRNADLLEVDPVTKQVRSLMSRFKPAWKLRFGNFHTVLQNGHVALVTNINSINKFDLIVLDPVSLRFTTLELSEAFAPYAPFQLLDGRIVFSNISYETVALWAIDPYTHLSEELIGQGRANSPYTIQWNSNELIIWYVAPGQDRSSSRPVVFDLTKKAITAELKLNLHPHTDWSFFSRITPLSSGSWLASIQNRYGNWVHYELQR